MLAIMLFAFGVFSGVLLLLTTGGPVLLLSYFRCLPFDRRLWWLFAGVVSYFAIRDAILSSYDYSPPTASPEKFYYEAHINGGLTGVVACSILMLVLLTFFFKSTASARMWFAIPAACIVLGIGIASIAANTRPVEEKRAALAEAANRFIASLQNGDAEALNLAIRNGAKLTPRLVELNGNTPLEYVIDQNQPELLTVLLAPPKGKPALVRDEHLASAIQSEDELLLTAFFDAPDSKTYRERALRATITLNDHPRFRRLLAAKVDPNACQRFDTPLIRCAELNRIEMARELLAAGAAVNQVHGSPDLNRGSTALVVAVDHGHRDLARLLLDAGADINKSAARHRSPLQAACRAGHYELAKLLLERKANVNHVAGRDYMPLHSTIKKESWNESVSEETKLAIVKLLLEFGADRTAVDTLGNTPLKLAEYEQLPQLVTLLSSIN